MLSYVISVLFMSCICYKYNLIKLKVRFVLVSLFMIISILSSYFIDFNNLYMYIFILSIILAFYVKDIIKLRKG
ncbi:hypothetical protein [Cetobacterium somerae]|uniref:hypothetical protein n=1 Tax=Cetobacterium somerae TaxID=188913 RepID=UPI003891AD94